MAEKRLATSKQPLFQEALIGEVRGDFGPHAESESLIVS
jgi:hypothetical protein